MRRLYLVTGEQDAREPIAVGPDEKQPPEPDGTDPPVGGEPAAALFNEQFSLSLWRRRYYINLRIGAELRADERRLAEGQVRVSGIAFFYCVICSAAIMLFGTICLIYLLKSAMGINLFDDQSFLHPLFESFGGQ